MDGEEIIGVYGTKGQDYFYSMGFIVWKPPKLRAEAAASPLDELLFEDESFWREPRAIKSIAIYFHFRVLNKYEQS